MKTIQAGLPSSDQRQLNFDFLLLNESAFEAKVFLNKLPISDSNSPAGKKQRRHRNESQEKLRLHGQYLGTEHAFLINELPFLNDGELKLNIKGLDQETKTKDACKNESFLL